MRLLCLLVIFDCQLRSVLNVNELSNVVLVSSSGPDGLFSTNDDITRELVDVHTRKIIKKGLQSGARSVGKGLAQGAIEGIREETQENINRTKRKTSELLLRFKLKENNE